MTSCLALSVSKLPTECACFQEWSCCHLNLEMSILPWPHRLCRPSASDQCGLLLASPAGVVSRQFSLHLRRMTCRGSEPTVPSALPAVCRLQWRFYHQKITCILHCLLLLHLQDTLCWDFPMVMTTLAGQAGLIQAPLLSLRDFMVPQNNHCQRFYHPPSQITGCWGILVPASKEQSSGCLLDRLRQSGGTCRDSCFGVTTLDDTTRVFQKIISCLSFLSKHIEHGEHTFSCF